jgi:hypothetical protein
VVAREADALGARRPDRPVEELLRVREDAVDEGEVGRPRDERRERRVLPERLLIRRDRRDRREARDRLRLRVDLLLRERLERRLLVGRGRLAAASSTTAAGFSAASNAARSANAVASATMGEIAAADGLQPFFAGSCASGTTR